MSHELLRIWKCSKCGYESEEWDDFVTDVCEKLTNEYKVDYIKRIRTCICPKCKGELN